jgi:hypothetical protein
MHVPALRSSWRWDQLLVNTVKLEHRLRSMVAVALANKFARIAWRLMISGGVYNRPVAAMPI